MLLQQAKSLNIEITIQVSILELATHSSRNLRLNEIANALEYRFSPSIILGTPEAIARIACAPILEIMEDETVQAIHHSFTEFSLDSGWPTGPMSWAGEHFPTLKPQRVHRKLALACLHYLQSGVLEAKGQTLEGGNSTAAFKTQECDCEEDENCHSGGTKREMYDYQQARLLYPFLDYAVNNLGYHSSKFNIRDEEFFLSIKAFSSNEPCFRRWLALVKAAKYLSPRTTIPSTLHFAAFSELTELANILLEGGELVESRDADEKTPLLWASSRRHPPMVSLLLQKGANADAEDSLGVKPIHLAARKNDSTTVKMLLEAGVDPRSPKTKEYIRPGLGRVAGGQRRTKGETAVQYVCEQGYTETFLVMIPFLRPETLEEVLCESCRYGKFEAARAVLENSDVSVNSKFRGATAIYLACTARSVDCAKLLLERGAGVNLTSREAMLSFNCDTLYFSKYNMMLPLPSRHTVRVGHIVKLLLAAGADVSAVDSDKLSPIDLAIFYGCHEMVKILQFSVVELQKRWQMEPGDRRFQTVTAFAQNPAVRCRNLPESLHQEILRHPDRYLTSFEREDIPWIIENGGNITSGGVFDPGNSFLHVIAWSGNTEIMECLGNLAQTYDCADSVRSLLMKSESSKPHLDTFYPVLYNVCGRQTPNLEMINILVEKCGVNVNSRTLVMMEQRGNPQQSVDGPTALHCLAKAKCWWQLDAIKCLVRSGAIIDSKNQYGETPLHITCGGGKSARDFNKSPHPINFWEPDCVQLLLDLSADPNSIDDDGMTPLYRASWSPKAIETLLRRGANVNIGKISPLFSVIKAQNVQSLHIILDAGVSPNLKDTAKDFPIHYEVDEQERYALFCTSFLYVINMCIKDSAPLVKLLIKRGADLDSPLSIRETLIHYVFEHAEYEIVCAFLDCAHMIDFNSRDQLGRTVFLAACNWTPTLPGHREKHWFSKEKAPVIRILDSVADLLAVDDVSKNALHLLLNNPNMEQDAILQFLRNNASNTLLHQKDENGFSPLNYALQTLRPVLVEKLLAMGADLLQPDGIGATVLHHIASQYLLIYQTQRENTLRRDQDPSYYETYLSLQQRFLNLGDDINTRENQGNPPLFWYLSTCNETNFSVSYAQLFKNADVHARNKDGETALHIVAKRDEEHSTKGGGDLFKFLVEKGLDPLAEDGKGRSSLDVAAACGKKGILDLLQY